MSTVEGVCEALRAEPGLGSSGTAAVAGAKGNLESWRVGSSDCGAADGRLGIIGMQASREATALPATLAGGGPVEEDAE